MANDYPFIRGVESPVTDHMLRPLEPQCRVVQFSSPLSDDEFRRLAAFLEEYPDVPLRMYGHLGQTPDLSFLRFFPNLQNFQADVWGMTDFDGLAYLPDTLQFLGLGQTKRRLSIKPIARFRQLRDLYLDGHTKDFSVVSELSELVYLCLRSITLSDLTPLMPLRNLRSLALKLGGTKDLTLLPELRELRYLELWMVKGLSDLTPIGQLAQLRYLFLQDLRRVVHLPDFSQLNKLVRCNIENLKGLNDICPIAAARNLRELRVANMPHIPVAQFNCLRDHPALQAAGVFLGSTRRNAEVAKLLNLLELPHAKPIKAYVEEGSSAHD
jgi:hypothetical protein